MRNSYTLYRFIGVLAAALMSLPALAQNHAGHRRCYTDEHFAQQVAKHPELLKARAELDAKIWQMQQTLATQRGVAAEKKIIPIVFHIIRTSGGNGNLDRNTVIATVNRLNLDFNRRNNDTLPVRFPGASMDFEFRLATLDPQGNCTDGITRVESDLSAGVEPRDDVKGVYAWPTEKYFNVWVVENIEGEISGAQGVIAGYAQFPMGQQGLGWGTWGVVIRSDAMGDRNDERTLTHEIGHCLNLYHTFQGDCGSSASNCATQGDQVCDTPPALLTQSQGGTENTCNTDNPNRPDNTENFMSYNLRQNMFSGGQRTRIYAALAAVPQLQNLTSQANLVATGTNDGVVPGLCPPRVDFFAGQKVACGITPIDFYSNIYNCAADASTRYLWTIAGSDSGTYHTSRPSVKFITPGVHDATLVISNAAGADTLTRNDYMGARPATGIGAVPITENFEAVNFPDVNPEFYKNWEISGTGPANINWNLVNVGRNGSRCLRVLHSGINGNFSRYLTSPGLDLRSAGNAKLYFWRAHKRRGANSDKLVLAFSTNCGGSWQDIYTWTDDAANPAQQLWTNPQTPSGLYTTPEAGDWKLDSVNVASRIAATLRGNVRLRFESANVNSNTLFIDDIYIAPALPVGVRNQLAAQSAIRMEVMPNPGTQSAEIRWSAGRSVGKSTIEILDAAGRVVGSRALKGAGTEGSLPVSELAPNLQKGVYLLRFRSETGLQATRFVLE